MYSDILATIMSTTDRDMLISEAEELKRAMFETKEGRLEQALKNEVRASVSGIIKNGIEKNGAEKYLNGLIDELKKMDEVKIVLAIEPTESLIGLIYATINKGKNASFVLNLEIDKNILGGALISYKGKYFDGSLAKLISSK